MKQAAKLTVIGGSAGSLGVLISVFPELQLSADRAIIIVLHRQAEGDTQLTDMLNPKTAWCVKESDDKECIRPGFIYFAPGGYHLYIEQDKTMSLDCSEKMNFSRPSINPTFETAADVYGANLRCLLLSGANADGVAGLIAAKELGAEIAIQDPAEAQLSYMPQSALAAIPDILRLGTVQIGKFLNG